MQSEQAAPPLLGKIICEIPGAALPPERWKRFGDVYEVHHPAPCSSPLDKVPIAPVDR